MILPYNNRCDILRAIRTADLDGFGGFTEDYQPHLTGVHCRRSGPTAADTAVAGARQGQVDAVLYADPEHDIREGDRVAIDGDVYVTLEPVKPSRPIYQKLMLRTIRR